MATEITQLTKVNSQVVDGECIKINSSGVNGREIIVNYLFDSLITGEQPLGKLHVHPNGVTLRLFVDNRNDQLEVVDTNTDGQRYPVDIYSNYPRVDLWVIESELWYGDVGVRIRHVS